MGIHKYVQTEVRQQAYLALSVPKMCTKHKRGWFWGALVCLELLMCWTEGDVQACE